MKIYSKIKYTVLPVGENAKQFETVQEGLYDTDTADEAFDYKNKLNHIISEHQYNSKYGILENWWIDEVEHLSKCDIGATNALKLLNHVKKNKTYKVDTLLKEHKNFWLDPYGKFHKVFAPDDSGDSHDEWAHNYLNKKYGKSLFDMLDCGESGSDFLEKLGFIRIQGWSKYGICFYTKKQPTLNQWESLVDFCLINELKVPYYDKRGWLE